MSNYFDFHSKDEMIAWSDDWNEYCEKRFAEKEEKWFPFLSFPITKKCNFHCLYCGMGGEATASANDFIPLELIKRYVGYGISKGLKKFRITGGEPFLHPQISEILNFMASTGEYVLVNTNGSLIIKNQEWLSKLPSTVKFAVSFDTLKPKTLELISKSHSHKEIVDGIRFLQKTGNLLRLNMVINKYNYEEVYDIIHFCQELVCDLKILDVVSVPIPFRSDRQDFYREVNTLEQEFAEKCDAVYSHEYSRGFGTPCYRYRFGDVYVTVKNSKKGSHYDVCSAESICKHCIYFPCHEGLYDLFCLSDGRLCSCRWTEEQKFSDGLKQMDWLIEIFKRSNFIYTGDNQDMMVREELKATFQKKS